MKNFSVRGRGLRLRRAYPAVLTSVVPGSSGETPATRCWIAAATAGIFVFFERLRLLNRQLSNYTSNRKELLHARQI